MYKQHHLSSAPDEVRHVVSAEQYIYDTHPTTESIFIRESLWVKLKIKFLQLIVKTAEYLCNTNFYSENELKELRLISPNARRTLSRLVRKGLVQNWMFDLRSPDAVPAHQFRMRLSPIELPNGYTLHMSGSTGSGVSDTLEGAVYPAVAELIERHATVDWTHREDIVRDTFNNLKSNNNVIDPSSLLSIDRDNKYDFIQFQNKEEAVEAGIDWMKGKDFCEEERVYIPAAAVYMSYCRSYKDQPFFWEVNSNASAAHTSRYQALYRATCEAIERDTFLGYWLNSLVPKRITLESVRELLPELESKIKIAEDNGFKIIPLFLESDSLVPVVVSVVIDTLGSSGVSVTADADYDVVKATKKALYESFKFTNYDPKHSTHKKYSREYFDDKNKTWNVTTLDSRMAFWSCVDMEEKITWFIEGEKISLANLTQRHNVPADPLQSLRLRFKELNHKATTVDLSSPLSKEFGLFVMRIVSTDLLPVYFDEAHLPFKFKRLYNFPVSIGYAKNPTKKKHINKLPHPFA